VLNIVGPNLFLTLETFRSVTRRTAEYTGWTKNVTVACSVLFLYLSAKSSEILVQLLH